MIMWRLSASLLLLASALSCRTTTPGADLRASASNGVQRHRFESAGRYLVIELLRDDLAHFELSERHDGPNPDQGIYTTPMVARQDWDGPTAATRNGNVVETSALRLTVDADARCVEAFDKARDVALAKICGEDLDQVTKRLAIDPFGMKNAYGVGNMFMDPSTADGDWSGRDWYGVRNGNERTDLGNVRADFNGAAPSMSQFPVVYALGEGTRNFGLFMDHAYRISWDFRDAHRWFAETWGDQLRWYLMAGPDVKALRSSFLDIVGKPLMPPKAVFGLWVSEFGYDGWSEIKDDLAQLRAANVPVDGFGLDLQWFGAGFGDSAKFKMGSLRFDPATFSDPAGEVRNLREKEGVRLITIEESYVNRALPEYDQVRQASGDDCYFVSHEAASCVPSSFGTPQNPIWWGWGGMLDWTNDAAGAFWHHLKRQPLAKLGITAHWTDLGEPEMYDGDGYYKGFPGLAGKNRHGDVHNLYNFKWLESIYKGYMRQDHQDELKSALNLPEAPRFFTMSRAGAPGIQRFGAGMWSGDVGRNMGTLRAHANTQMHMSMAGLDYYNSDAGGFTWALNDYYNDAKTDGQYRELYTQWFADSCLADLPVRPHGWAMGDLETSYSPVVKGFKDSNAANVWQRYELIPYLYTMAWRAHTRGEPLIPPLVYHFQSDGNVRRTGNEKMYGDSLLFAMVAGYGETDRPVYLPKGRWIDYHTHESIDSSGGETASYPVYMTRYGLEGVLTLPLFARAGAIIPKMFLDKDSLNAYGKRRDGKPRPDLIARVYADEAASAFTLYEDDGETLGYMKGQARTTIIEQKLSGATATVKIAAAKGSYDGAPTQRARKVEIVVRDAVAKDVSLDGQTLPACADQGAFDYGTVACFLNAERNLIVARTASDVPVSLASTFEAHLETTARTTSVHFVCDGGATSDGEAVYVAGDGLPGGWEKPVKLAPTRYPRWTGHVRGLAAGAKLSWKCLRKRDGQVGTFEPGENHKLTTAAGGFTGTVVGKF